MDGDEQGGDSSNTSRRTPHPRSVAADEQKLIAVCEPRTSLPRHPLANHQRSQVTRTRAPYRSSERE